MMKGWPLKITWRANSENPAGKPKIHSGTIKSLMELPPTVTAPPSPAPNPTITITAIETSVEVAMALEALMAIQLVTFHPLMLT